MTKEEKKVKKKKVRRWDGGGGSDVRVRIKYKICIQMSSRHQYAKKRQTKNWLNREE